MLIFSTSRGKMIAWLFVLRKAKQTRRGETAIRFGMSMPRQTILVFAPFLPLQHIFLPIPVSQMWRTSPRPTRMAIFLVVFSPGGDQYGRFMDCLRQDVEKNQDMFLGLGICPGDLGSHSAWKGAYSFAAVGSTVCPPMVSICLQAMWSMGSVKERYLQFEKAGNQYLGRVVSGLDVNDVSFAILPPYFECGDNEGDMREKIFTLLKEFTVGGHGF